MGSEILFAIALLVAVSAIFWLILKNSSEKIAAQYRALAEHFKFELEQPSAKLAGLVRPEPSVYGRYRGRELSISCPGKGLQNTRQVETVLKVALNKGGFRAQLAAAGPLGGLRQRDSGGLPRWESGYADFDAAVDVRTNAGERLQALLDSSHREWLATQLKKSKSTLYIGKEALAYSKLGLMANEDTRQDFEAAIQFICELAETIENT